MLLLFLKPSSISHLTWEKKPQSPTRPAPPPLRSTLPLLWPVLCASCFISMPYTLPPTSRASALLFPLHGTPFPQQLLPHTHTPFPSDSLSLTTLRKTAVSCRNSSSLLRCPSVLHSTYYLTFYMFICLSPASGHVIWASWGQGAGFVPCSVSGLKNSAISAQQCSVSAEWIHGCVSAHLKTEGTSLHSCRFWVKGY